MPAKPRRYPIDDNFRRLPDDKATRRLIDPMLDMRDPLPWNERPIRSSRGASNRKRRPAGMSGSSRRQRRRWRLRYTR
jgi:hypothetical protein